jgi:hypothetical protein
LPLADAGNASAALRRTKLVLFSYALMGLLDVLDAILKRFALWRKKLSNSIGARSALSAEIVHKLAYLVFMVTHVDLLWCGAAAYGYVCLRVHTASDEPEKR